MSRFWSPKVQRLRPYIPGEQPKNRSFIKLNTNENPYGPSAHVLNAIKDAADDGLKLYPDPTASQLRTAIGSTFELEADHIFVGNGSDEVLAHAFNAFFSEKAAVLFADITYSFYKTYCELFALEHQLIPLNDDLEYNPQDYSIPCGGIVIANPNAPTGIAMGLDQIETILKQNPDVVVLVDEAYVDFGADSAVSLVPCYDNLLVAQTFSKSRSLAGLRVGFAIGQPHLIEALNRIKDSFNSYPLDRLALAGALAAWEDQDAFEETRNKVMRNREQTARLLKEQGFWPLTSSTNFLFVAHQRISAAKLYEELRARGILVRHFNQPRIDNWLRISIGTEQECTQLVEATGQILSGA